MGRRIVAAAYPGRWAWWKTRERIGTPRVVADLRAGRSAREILAADREDHAAWRVARRSSLLY
jgi:hypothetical protein